ncbi:hypothetical protein HC028_14740 [Planosporangium flavigriseum]|uniref:Uncharacterized protein n=1 Tax=Planosporangium flavigriseum TaxID=373681 RepID=A0A8J3PN56_9ACTN|nr:hypothetical protein [Planosporangium flavigriseum]NJC65747.1 hypothetical protein [Planosporangium flavigriseum]GIG73601.1 hypothetical protein Pfl04_20050 [Planosporangium flavigriseum]
MNGSSLALSFMLLAAALLPVGLILQLSNWAHSRFRNHLWNLRDSLVDDLLSGAIELSPGAIKLLDLIETHIRDAKRHSFSDVMLAVVLLGETRLPSITDDMLNDRVPLTDRQALLKYFSDFRAANLEHLLNSSPSGWIAAAFLWLAKHTFRRRPDAAPVNPELQKQVIRVELRVMPEFMPAKHPKHNGPITDSAVAA